MTDAICGIDLGSAWTVIAAAGRGVLLDEPTVVARSRDRQITGAGRAALAQSVRARVGLQRPVRRGRVLDPAGCIHLLAAMFDEAAIERGSPARIATPVGASPYDLAVLAGVVSAVTGTAALPVPSLVAGAEGARLDTVDGTLVCDIGAGVTEIGVVEDGRLVSAMQRRMGLREYERNPLGAIREWADAPEAVVASLPASGRRRLRGNRVALLGGGAEVRELSAQLSAVWGRPVHAVAVRHPVVLGLVASPPAALPAA